MSSPPLQFDPSDRAVINNPFPIFARLQEEAPIHWSDTARGWVVTRYEDCKAVLLDKRYSSARMEPFFESLSAEQRAKVAGLESSVGLWAVFLDPPEHTRLRRLLNRGFTSRAVNGMAPRIAEIVHELIDDVAGKPEIDFIRDIAYRIPAAVIMEMMGVSHSEVESFKLWSDDIGLFVGGSKVTPEKYVRAEAATKQMCDAFRDLITERRRNPREDMITDLIRAEDEGQVLDEQELIATCVMLLFAGHETTGNLFGTGMYHFLHHPEQFEALRRHPELAENAVEEILRYDGPNGAMTRVASEDLTLGGHTIRKGKRVFVMLNAANRDPELFEDPHTFDIRRKPNGSAAIGQFAFGHGIHFCIGAPLARLEGRIALPIFADRIRHPKMIGGEPDWIDSLNFRGLTQLPMSCEIKARSK
ncbi:MAG: cytochrome P450 [Candidatus Reddybacter sp.]